MFIPPKHQLEQHQKTREQFDGVHLRSGHLIIAKSVVEAAFGADVNNVFTVYYPDRKSLIVANSKDELFKKLHKASQQMLKAKNFLGDKSLAIQEICIDNGINSEDRNLQYELQRGLGILKVEI